MNIVGKLGMAFVLSLIASSVAVSSASAETFKPEVYLYEVSTFLNLGGETSLETAHSTVTCEHQGGSLERDGTPWGFSGTAEYYGCKQHKEINGVKVTGPCNTSGAGQEVIKTNNMEAKLFDISKANKEVGLVLNYQSSGEVTTFATFTCTVLGIGEKFTLRGTALAKATPVNVKTESLYFTLSGSKGVPALNQYQNYSGVNVTTALETQRGTGLWEGTSLNNSASPLHFLYSKGAVAELRP